MPSAKTFFSYCRNDQAFALRLAQDLRQAGIQIWFDQLDIPPGRRWDNEIQKALGTADSLLVVLSPASVASENVMDEVSFALDQNKHVIPVLHQPCDVPLRIRRLQYIDFTSNYEAGLTHLLRVLRETKPENGESFESVLPAAGGKTEYKTGTGSGQSATDPSNKTKRKPLLYGAGAIVLALLLFFVVPRMSKSQNSDLKQKSELEYVFNTTDKVDKPTAKSVLQSMKDFKDSTKNLEPLPHNLSYALTKENDCYQFYILKEFNTKLPEGWNETINNFGMYLNRETLGEYCLTVGTWDQAEGKWQDSVQFNNEPEIEE